MFNIITTVQSGYKTNKRVIAKALSDAEDVLIGHPELYDDGTGKGIRKIILDAINDACRNWEVAVMDGIEK
jgi:hypothetical protein